MIPLLHLYQFTGELLPITPRFTLLTMFFQVYTCTLKLFVYEL